MMGSFHAFTNPATGTVVKTTGNLFSPESKKQKPSICVSNIGYTEMTLLSN
jgi:hypothetical protein